MTTTPFDMPVRNRVSRYHLLGETGWPYLVLRLGTADPEHAGPALTPRLLADQVIEIAT
jgi:hypothetical protein